MPFKRMLKRLKRKYIFWNDMPYIMQYDKHTDFPFKEIDVEALILAMQSKIKMIAKVISSKIGNVFEFDDILQMVNITTLQLTTTFDPNRSSWKTYWNSNIIRRTLRELDKKHKCYKSIENKILKEVENERFV